MTERAQPAGGAVASHSGSMEARLDFWSQRLSNLPRLTLPSDYPRPASSQVVQAVRSYVLPPVTCRALARLGLYEEGGSAARGMEDSMDGPDPQPRLFHLLLAAFIVLLHRYTGDTDIVVGTSQRATGEALVLRVAVDPGDSYWQVAKRVQALETEAAEECVPLDMLLARLARDQGEAEAEGATSPLFRVRCFDETGSHMQGVLQRTNLTTDMTLFLTPPEVVLDAEGASSGAGAPPTDGAGSTQDHTPAYPAAALHLLYNSLLFSAQRVQCILAQITQVIHEAARDPMVQIGRVPIRAAEETKVLPDPRRDLDWCGYRGSITSIFERNARSYPERRCLVESVLPNSGVLGSELPPPAETVRTLSYGELDRASNVVAHRLLQAGVSREEVVTVYAHRGIDMVIAVIATLKAGGTFSVIDPGYPPSRQNVYLQVAKPRALVVLAKAGQIHPQVRECIQNELQLRVEIPALELTPDGTLRGGEVDGEDVLASAQPLAAQSTGVVLGPDSVATLSFTSGSTGIPKGVQGRHYSLTHFFPWMGERFALSSQDHFTMLSGIAHDPIQRDIFTPLFFGAELHIPTAEDIGTPGRLAEWMARSHATVTHLTPAMGQLLSAQATEQIPSLRNAFFVGDILTKRDCTRLQALAPHVRIINMYGTTETQRAVSYFAIPPVSEQPAFLQAQKDVMPAGQGMIDVQLLVVNRNDRRETCAIGEVGEIYVRSGGLAEGYLGPPELSAEKFVSNWLAPDLEIPDTLRGTPEGEFWKGPRDRMYRTGDLGRYLPDGTVECTGRADDQIKIRGFRIELGEIDTHLSRHPRVRENVTLVRRDKDEEKVLVSYFVPMAESDAGAGDEPDMVEAAALSREQRAVLRGIQRHRELIRDIRDHLKRKLPSYSVPTLFVPLVKMPLNPNGKIDKPALPFPDTAMAASVAQAAGSRGGAPQRAMSATEQTIAQLWAQLLPAPPQPMPLDESFFDLGGHSILATRLVFAMRQAFVMHVPLGLVFDAPSVSALARAIDGMRAGELALADASSGAGEKKPAAAELPYAEDAAQLEAQLPASFPRAAPPAPGAQRTVLLTGATGFLGAFLLHDLLEQRGAELGRVYVHVRATNREAALQRLRDALSSRGLWREAWVSEDRLDAVVGDLAAPDLGVAPDTWRKLAEEVDMIVHNGALVHWVYPYARLRAANVLSTVAAARLAAVGKPKTLTFVSSTSALDTAYYVRMSDAIQAQSKGEETDLRSPEALAGVSEDDDLQGSAQGLGTGYGQTKWVAERLLFTAAARGLAANIVRPGYVVGDSRTGVTNTDDFLWRLVKGSVQLGFVPDIHNTVNMVPVDHVARIVALAALDAAHTQPSATTHACVYHVTSHPTIRYSAFLGALARYGWRVERREYVEWRQALENHVLSTASDAAQGSEAASVESNALFPLLHFVLDDLPTSTKSAELDDRHTEALLRAHGELKVVRGVDTPILGLYLAWLVAVGFLPAPDAPGALKLPPLPEGTVVQAVGRGSAN